MTLLDMSPIFVKISLVMFFLVFCYSFSSFLVSTTYINKTIEKLISLDLKRISALSM